FHTLFLFALLVILARSIKITPRAVAIIVPFFLFLLVYLALSMGTSEPEYLIEKLEGGFGATTVGALLLIGISTRYGTDEFLDQFLKFGLLILVLTIGYKSVFGLMARDVRFFINGPIVFGWLMGQFAIIATFRALNGRNPTQNFILATLFASATVWTFSKGPILALLVVFLLLFLRKAHRARTQFLLAALLLTVVAGVNLVGLENFGRLYAFANAIFESGEIGEFGTASVRLALWVEALDMWETSPMFGIGPGNFKHFTIFGGFRYPHNLMIELLAETGLVGLFLFLLFLLMIFLMTNALGRLIMVFSLIGSSFSGDLAYLRVMVLLPFLFAIAMPVNQKVPR
ncbi:O-antigen ligase family protein, partial [Maritalea sp.]|uniref:O-antigen ligase family protein n=1 Tax=Maritalea sp. TaxID=2003361 RepID=UPI003EF1865F